MPRASYLPNQRHEPGVTARDAAALCRTAGGNKTKGVLPADRQLAGANYAVHRYGSRHPRIEGHHET